MKVTKDQHVVTLTLVGEDELSMAIGAFRLMSDMSPDRNTQLDAHDIVRALESCEGTH